MNISYEKDAMTLRGDNFKNSFTGIHILDLFTSVTKLIGKEIVVELWQPCAAKRSTIYS